MKKIVTVMIAALCCVACLSAAPKKNKKNNKAAGNIKVGILNNPPSESGYRAANVADFERVFNASNGYDVKVFYSDKIDDQLSQAATMINDGVDYLLISAAGMTGWDATLKKAQKAGIKVYLFDREIDSNSSLYEAGVVSDMVKEGETAVNWLKSQKLKEYNVIHIQGVLGTAAQIGRTGALDKEFAAGTMKKVIQQTGNWGQDAAKSIVESVINSGAKFNVIYAENDDMAKGAVAALDEAGITHGVKGDVIIMGFDCNKWALRELLAGNWNYDGQCSPFQADIINDLIKSGKAPANKKIINEEKGFDAKTITKADVEKYGLGD